MSSTALQTDLATDPLALAAFLDDRPWAMTAGALRSLLTARYHPDFEALAARMGRPLDGGRGVQNVNGTAVLNIRGPLLRYRSIFTWLLGGTAVEDASLGLQAALDDPGVRNIVMAINSPGGQIDGINEFANMVRAANAVKPVTAYVEGMAASGAYWIAAAAGKIVADETSLLGSIGVLATIVDESAADEKRGVKRYDVVSSQSPLKRTDPATDEGRAQLQQMVDALAQLFIEKVAAFRGVGEGKVVNNFGKGGVRPAREAVAFGMADSLGSLQALLDSPTSPMSDIRDVPAMRVAAFHGWLHQQPAKGQDRIMAALAQTEFDETELEDDTEETELNNDPSNCPPGADTCDNGGDDTDDESEGTEQEPDDSSVPGGEGTTVMPTEERQRIAAILSCEEARGREELARTLALETDLTLEAATKILKSSPVPAKPAANALEQRMQQLQNPTVGVPGDAADPNSAAAEIARILAFVPKERLRAHARVQ